MGMENVWKQEVILQERDGDYRALWKPQAILMIMQELSGYHSAHLGFGRPQLVSNGMVWVLSRLRLEMLSYSRAGDRLDAYTWAAPVESLFFPRYFEFYDRQGKLVAHANTLWVLMDIRKRKLLRPSAVEGNILVAADRPFGIPSPGRVSLPEELPLQAMRRVTYSDLDLNGHMNNAQYAAWTCDFFQEQTLSGECLSSFQVSFIAEALPGDDILLRGAVLGDEYYLQGTRGEQRIFEACGTFQKVEASGFEVG